MKNHYETMYKTTATIDDTSVLIPKGTPLKRLIGGGKDQPNFYVVDKPSGASIHIADWNTYYLQPEDHAVFQALFIREPLSDKSVDWRETANKWLIDIRGQKFDYYTGVARKEPPTYDDVMHSLLLDSAVLTMTFEDFVDEFNYNLDSRKAYRIWEDCCDNARKLIKTGLDLDAEKLRLADY